MTVKRFDRMCVVHTLFILCLQKQSINTFGLDSNLWAENCVTLVGGSLCDSCVRDFVYDLFTAGFYKRTVNNL